MSTRKCRKCNTVKERKYLMLNAQCRSIYLDENLRIWNGAVCFECKQKDISEYLHTKKEVKPLAVIKCPACSNEFKQRSINNKYCSKKCKLNIKYRGM